MKTNGQGKQTSTRSTRMFERCFPERDGSKLFGACVVRKGADKTPLNLKMIQQVESKPFIYR